MLQQFTEKNRDIVVNINGKLVHRDAAAISPFDSSVQGGDAVWEGLRLYKGKIFRLTEHLDRLKSSAVALAFAQIPSHEQIIEEVKRTLTANKMFDDVHIRLTLTPKGCKAFATLDETSRRTMGEMLAPLARGARQRLVAAMQAVETVLEPSAAKDAITLRAHRPGDLGWVVERHGVLYQQEYGWGALFEALVADIVAKFLRDFDPQRERCWIAEQAGDRVGSVFVVKEDRTTAKLRLLLIEPPARGAGLGKRLVEECVAFARKAGYRKLVLWTHANLLAARTIYTKLGFRKVKSEPHRQFGVPVVGEYWELQLTPLRRRGT